MKEFGITKAMIVKQAYDKMGKIQVVNNQGQITNQEKFNEALMSLMTEKFTGGMEKQAGTLKGLWSTVTGVTKTALANIVGITNEGTIRQGSLMESLKSKVKDVGDTFTRWQSDGTVQRISDTITTGFGIAKKVFEGFADALKWAKNNADWLVPAISAVTIAIVAQNGIESVIKLYKVWTTVTKGLTFWQSMLAIVSKATPFGWIALAIGAVVTAGILLWKNWDKVSAFLQSTWQSLKATASTVWNGLLTYFSQVGSDIKTSVTTKFNDIKTSLIDTFNTISNKATEIWNNVKVTVEVVAGTITGLMLPTLVKLGVQFAITASQAVGSWLVMQGQAIATGIVYAVTVVPSIIASFVQMGIQATINALKVVGSWVMMGIQATINAVKIVASWVLMSTQAVISGAIIVGAWVLMGVQSMIQATRMAVAWVIALGPIAWVSALIVGLVVLVIANWDTIRAKTIEIWSATTQWLSGVWTSISDTVSSVWNGIGSTITGIWDGVTSGIKGSINFIINAINSLIRGMNSVKFDIPDWVPVMGGNSFGLNIPEIPNFATGTNYFTGGFARTDEHGGEIKQYPNGTKVIPHDLSKQMVGGMGSGVNVYLTVQGNVIGDTEFVDQIATKLYYKLTLAHSNL